MRSFTLIFLLLLGHTYSYAQKSGHLSNRHSLKKNVIQGTYGQLVYYGGANLNYERMLGHTKQGVLSYWLKIGYGIVEDVIDDFSGQNATVAGILLSGSGKNHLELVTGYTFMHDPKGYKEAYRQFELGSRAEPTKNDFRKHALTGSFGYRYQKPDGEFVFRLGVGYPEIIFIGVGVGMGN